MTAPKVPKSCKGCIYRCVTSGYSTCDYAWITGHIRGCAVEDCTHKTLKSEKKSKKENSK